MLKCLEPVFLDRFLMLEWHPYLWRSGLNSLHITSNSLIALFYYSISILLVYCVRQQRHLPDAGIFMICGVFTLASGTTHLMDAWMLWSPKDWLAEGIEAMTVAIALLIAMRSIGLFPKILGQPRPTPSKAANQSLTPEILISAASSLELGGEQPNTAGVHAWYPDELQKLKAELEQRISEWTAALERNKEQLKSKIEGSKQLEEELHWERDFSRTLIETSSAFFVAVNADGKTMMMNQGYLKALGYTLDEVVGTDYLSTFVPEADREPVARIFEQLVKFRQPTLNENRVLTKDGRELLVEWRRRAIFNKSGELDFFFGIGIDITQRRLSEKESARLASIALLSPNPIVETDLMGQVRYLNPEAMRLFPELQNTGTGHPFLAGVPLMATVLQREGSFRREVKIGEIYYEQVLHYVPEIECLRIYAFDITERKQVEEQLLHNAFYDQLTGLSNRALFMDRLRQAVRRAKQGHNNTLSQPYLFAVLFLNLNRFKLVNESLGNRIGDQLLQCFARRLQTCLHPTDTVARLGGDEFAVLLEGIRDVSDATRVADAINQTLNTPFYLNECEVFMTLSIGIALNTSSSDRLSETGRRSDDSFGESLRFGNGFAERGRQSNDRLLQPEDLLRDADIAMYSAKAKGKTYYEVFDAAMHSQSVDRLQMETDLRRAIERQEFQIYYQPIVSLLTGRITGFEALLRWHHPKRGLVSPTEFIPTAEETGLITPIGWWTLGEACRQLKVWQEQFPSTQPLTMNVNLSCRQFTQPDLLEQIDKVLQETELAIGSLKLEITESVVMENPDLVKDVLLELKKRKIHLCIDDFGTGYSSLSRLHHFPISTLKIDRSFVSRIGALGENSEIVQAIVTLAQTLSMDVVAEGIEVSEQVSPLIALQCEYGQGYFFSRPVDSEAARALLMAEWNQR